MKLILLGLIVPLIPINMSVGSHSALSVTETIGLLLIFLGTFLEGRKDPLFRKTMWFSLGGLALCVGSVVSAKIFDIGFIIDQTMIPGSALPRFFLFAMLGGAALIWLDIEIARQVLDHAKRVKAANMRPAADKAWKLYAITYVLTKALTIGMVCVTVGQPADVFAADHNLLMDTIMPFYLPAVVCEILSYTGRIWLVIRLMDFFQKDVPAPVPKPAKQHKPRKRNKRR